MTSRAGSGERPRVGRRSGNGRARTLWARREPLIWLHAGGLVLCVAMIAGLIGLILYQGMVTFWPVPVIQLRTIDGRVVLGEVARSESFRLSFASIDMFEPEAGREAERRLGSAWHDEVAQRLTGPWQPAELSRNWNERSTPVWSKCVELLQEEEVPAGRQAALRSRFIKQWEKHREVIQRVTSRLRRAVTADRTGSALSALEDEWLDASETWLLEWADAEPGTSPGDTAAGLEALSGHHLLQTARDHVTVEEHRRLLRVGNFERSNEHFRWVSDFEVARGLQSQPRWAVVLERLAWGRFYGTVRAFRIDGKTVATEPAEVWRLFRQYHPPVRQRWHERRRLEKDAIGRVNARLEAARLEVRRIELRHGASSPEHAAARRNLQATEQSLEREFAAIHQRIEALDRLNAPYELVLGTSDGAEVAIRLADIVRGYLPNQLGFVSRCRLYGARWWEFLTQEPREANTEGGVLPAIWGTVAMTLLMAILVLPLGVLAALYLQEYARSGWVVSVIRIAVNNLAGIPSIVFGVFGLGFFCYIIGARIDELFFAPRLPSPTFGTGGLLWASLTLALLTLPVVIVATEEALAAVPRSVREGSLACGATKWQTVRRIVLPQALPGILTGMILAMARGAGEVAPLMLVGAVKLAPDLPVDAVAPYIHLERSFMHLGFHIYDLGFQSQSSEAAKPMVFTTTLLLITLIAVTNIVAIRIRSRLRRRHVQARF